MINLLPPQARKHVLTEYWLRTVSVWFLLAVTAGVVVLTLLFPTYVLIKLQLQAHEDTYQQVEIEHETFQRAQAEIRNANANATLLANAADAQPLSEILDTVKRLQAAEIFIQEVSMQREGREVNQVVISGEAATRDALAAFRNRLESAALFETVDLPLENLARDREVPFSITVTLSESRV